MSFGLAGGPATFLGVMHETLQPLLRVCVLVFSDDILVYSKTLEEHIQHLCQIFHLLRQDQWKVKRFKCSFGQQELSYLGRVISATGVATNPSKLQVVAAWPATDAKEVQFN